VTLWVGTSGWQYRHWRGRFYPAGVAQARWLEHYAARFRTVEVNNAFYRLPSPAVVEQWRSRTPDDFVLAMKASRYLTHIKRLKDPSGPVALLLERAAHLGPKLGPLLLQLPPTLRADAAALDDTLARFGAVRVAVEPRHDSWFTDEVFDVLARHGAALCLVDTLGRRPPLVRTTDWGYVRFHHGRAHPEPCYGRTALAGWAERLAGLFQPGRDVFAFFNNDECGCAVRDARRFALAASKVGLRPTRVPAAAEVRGCGQEDGGERD
jgi:uncharacterized protein YecE (DUF72 family)